MSTIIVFVYLGLQVKWNQFSANSSHHTSCTHKGSHVGKWPDLITSKPNYVSTLGYHWTDHTGRPLELQVHWDATGTTLADASTQWCPSCDPVLICIIGTYWKTTGRPLEAHWKHTGYQQFFLQWHSSVHWGLIPGTLDCHWIATGRPLAQGKGQAVIQNNVYKQQTLCMFHISWEILIFHVIPHPPTPHPRTKWWEILQMTNLGAIRWKLVRFDYVFNEVCFWMCCWSSERLKYAN